ncbi:uncharacterized protein BJ212DRAFT_1476457 [Suillus subaureus]|uniref:Uncharacterized protein n=1 Tax=Suillus subaureus TaxID=48587 RepID=A0A9P7JI30_9AGAM|nr:uncharacterized protein BJ212DRAFT_1476457 [Suillus subaureus]KAG1823589.1 hypothetical protein BJ212DRAFT_1476457 [Suillus subaureus]
MSSLTINKTDSISVCGNIIFLEIDGVLPNWKNYCIKLNIETPGVKTLVFHLCNGADPNPSTSDLETKHESMAEEGDVGIKVEKVEGKIKFEEDVPAIKEEDALSDLDQLEMSCALGTATPCIHLSQITRNPDPATRQILLDQFRPWRHIVRPFSASDIPRRLAQIERCKTKMFNFDF